MEVVTSRDQKPQQKLLEMIRTDATLYSPGQYYTLSSGIKSPVLFKLDTVLARPFAAKAVADFFLRAMKDRGIEFNGVGGMETGSIVISNSISLRSDEDGNGKTIFTIKKAKKFYGDRSMYDGIIDPGSRVLIVDDVGTTGGAICKAARYAKAAGAEVVAAGVVVDRDLGAQDACDIMGIPYFYMFSGKEVLSGMGYASEITRL